MKVLLAIKPVFVEKIFSGEKRFEFRKVMFKSKEIKDIVMYASYPISKVVGEFTIESVIVDKPDVIWRITKDFAGVNETFFKQYFHNKDKAYAIHIGDCLKYQNVISLSDIGVKHAPQSFLYLR